MGSPATGGLPAGSARRAEVVAALSLGTDLGLGQPLEHALRSAILAVRIGEAEGLSAEELKDTYYLAMLTFVGCTAAARPIQAVFGDEIEARGWLTPAFMGHPSEMMAALAEHVGAGLPPEEKKKTQEAVFAAFPSLPATGGEQCEVAQMLSRSLRLGPGVDAGLGQVFERWDGLGVPRGTKGSELARGVLVAQLARNVDLFFRVGGLEAVLAMAKRRAGSAHDPAMVERFCTCAAEVVQGLESCGWAEAIAAEPGRHDGISGAELDEALGAMGDFVDLKTPFFFGHSRGVSALAERAARAARLSDAEVLAVKRAGLVHDVGRAGVSVRIWDKVTPLNDAEWERIRLHAYYTERILDRIGLPDVAAIASRHHERQDGSGYHRKLAGSGNPPGARILAAADSWRALTEERPFRPPFPPERAAAALEIEVRSGRLDAQAVQCVLSAAGQRSDRPRRSVWPAGLTSREVEVLRLVARGLTNALMAEALTLSPSTVDHHVRHIYDKLGVSTRAAAALFAIQNELLGPPAPDDPA